MSATEYTVDLRDLKFILFEQLKIQDTLAEAPQFADFDITFYDSILEEATKLAVEAIAPCNKDGDVIGAKFDKGTVTCPPSFKEAYDTQVQAGWLAISAKPEYGGMGLPEVMGMAVTDVQTGANMALSIYTGLTKGVGNLLVEFGDDWMNEIITPKLYMGEWAGTMLLTEAGAGSDVGENRCKAVESDEDGVYLLEGEKIFISGGDQDLTENIIHVVLARLPDAEPGTRGLSIFMVPKKLIDEEGNIIGENDIVCSGIEEKMGIHGSATCTMALGANGPCKGWILGEEGQGMKIMFHLMNEARIFAGLQGVAVAAPAYLNSLAYAKERLQGPDINNFRDPEAPRVPIAVHPDIRRMLMTQKVMVETMRGFLYSTAAKMDQLHATDDPTLQQALKDEMELYTPICKSHCTDEAFLMTSLAVQVLGGYGYCSEYPVEQYLRDCRITAIYEGANGIQAMDLMGRKLSMRNGMLFMQWLQRITAQFNELEGGEFDEEVEALAEVRDLVSACGMHLFQYAMGGKLSAAMLESSNLLSLFGVFLLGMTALEQAVVAQEALDEGCEDSDEAFYQGKILNLKFYVSHILPKAYALAKTIQSGDDSALDEILFPIED
jgi:alkylation response protein AidB-like acyl-CoA dehydrogenase